MITYYPVLHENLHRIAQDVQDALNDGLYGQDMLDVVKHVKAPYYVSFPDNGTCEIKVGELVLITITKEEDER